MEYGRQLMTDLDCLPFRSGSWTAILCPMLLRRVLWMRLMMQDMQNRADHQSLKIDTISGSLQVSSNWYQRRREMRLQELWIRLALLEDVQRVKVDTDRSQGAAIGTGTSQVANWSKRKWRRTGEFRPPLPKHLSHEEPQNTTEVSQASSYSYKMTW